MNKVNIDQPRLRSIQSSEPQRGLLGWQETTILLNKSFPEPALAFALMDHAVCLGMFKEKKFIFYNSLQLEAEFLQSLRVFNSRQELYIWRQNREKFHYRLRVDEAETGDDYVVDANQLLWGNSGKLVTDQAGLQWRYLFERRGIEIYLPAQAIPKDDGRIWLQIRNYIDYNELGQAGYVDSRFVEFIGGRGR